jgi:hypothetical protein
VELQSNEIVMAVGFEVEMTVSARRVEVNGEGLLCVGVVRIRGRWYYSVQLGLTDHGNGIAGDEVVPAGSDAIACVDPVAAAAVDERAVAVVEENEMVAVDKPNVPKGVGSQSMADEET